MSRVLVVFFSLFILALPYGSAVAQGTEENEEAISMGNGYLLLGGGGNSNALTDSFFKLINDPEALIVIIPTNVNDDMLRKMPNASDQYRSMFAKRYRHHNVEVLHTRDKNIANKDEFVEPLRRAKAVWILGGRATLMADAYLGTKVEAELKKLLSRGGIIAGYSGGATIAGSTLIRGQYEDNTVVMGDHKTGFGLLPNSIVDQHLLARNRQFDMFEALKESPDCVGIGLDENSGIIVHNGSFEVFGSSYVAVYDGNMWDSYSLSLTKLKKKEQQFYFLKPGERYDLHLRQPVSFINKKDLALPAVVLKKYVGVYRSDQHPEYSLNIFMDGDELKLENSWDTTRTYTLLAESEDLFFYRDGRKQFQFKTVDGRIHGVLSILDEKHYWTRQKSDLHQDN